jgi:hypothetical protein
MLMGAAGICVGTVGTLAAPTRAGIIEDKAAAEVLRFVRFALHDRLLAGDIPDIEVARRPGEAQVLVRADLPSSRMMLTDEALPEVPGLRLELVTLAAARETAERTGKDVGFVTIDKVQVGDVSAVVWLGADYAAREQPGLIKLCCCEGEARFVKRDGTWVFEKWGWSRCS